MQKLIIINDALNAFAWGPVMLALFIGVGIYFSVRLGFIQAAQFKLMLKKTLGGIFKRPEEDSGENLTPFQAMCAALAGTVGTGNIAGVTGAMFVGGAGAVFWMWVSAFLGMSTKYAEIVLAMKYRRQDADGKFYGGPMYYIEDGLGREWQWLAYAFAFLGGMASFGIGNIAQGTEISAAASALFNLDARVTGLILAGAVGLIILGGIRRIGSFTAILVPFMSAFYILAGLFIIIIKLDALPAAFGMIIKGAFSTQAAAGGLVGCGIRGAIRQGVARGVFSNEAGLGSAPIIHAASDCDEPCEQALWGMLEVFLDTIVICTITALALLLSGVCPAGGGISSGGAAAAAAFDILLPGDFGGKIIRLSMIFFALSSIVSWSYYGERCFSYICGESRAVKTAYRLIFSITCYFGATGSGELMWGISDTLNGLMALPNLLALLLLSGRVKELSEDYFSRQRA